MSNKNIQMKNKNGSNWDNLYPITLTDNVFDKDGESLPTQLAQKVEQTEVLRNKRASDILSYAKPSNVPGREFTLYQAIVSNPLDIDYPNVPIAIKVGFEKGECPNEKHIRVTRQDGYEMAFQWEGDRHPNYLKKDDLSKWSDGSLRFGTLWVYHNLKENEQLVIHVKVYSAEQATNFGANVTLGTEISGDSDQYTDDVIIAGPIKYKFTEINNYTFRQLIIGDSAIDNKNNSNYSNVAVKNNINADQNANEQSQATVISKKTEGSGVIFLDHIVKLNYVALPSVITEITTRVFRNGTAKQKTSILLTETLANGTFRGINFKYVLPETGNTQKDNYLHSQGSTKGLLMQYFATNVDKNASTLATYDARITRTTTSSGGVGIYANWTQNAREMPKDSYFESEVIFTPIESNGADVVDYSLRAMNWLNAQATTANPIELKEYYMQLSASYFANMYQFRGNMAASFTGLNLFLDLVNAELTDGSNEEKLIILNQYIERLKSMYGGFSTEGIKNAWLGGRGIEYLGRESNPIKYFLELSTRLNATSQKNFLINSIHNLADFYVFVETYSDGGGKIKLTFDGADNFNSMATAIYALNESLEISENTTRRSTMDRIIAHFESGVLFKNILPKEFGESILINPMGHYHSFSLFEYVRGLGESPFDSTAYPSQFITPAGKIDEVGFNAPKRYGFYHTSLYTAWLLQNKGDLSSLAMACSLLENTLSKQYGYAKTTYPLNGGTHEYPLDGWVGYDTIDEAIESQICATSLMDYLYFGK